MNDADQDVITQWECSVHVADNRLNTCTRQPRKELRTQMKYTHAYYVCSEIGEYSLIGMTACPRWPVLRDECGAMQCGPIVRDFRVESPGQRP